MTLGKSIPQRFVRAGALTLAGLALAALTLTPGQAQSPPKAEGADPFDNGGSRSGFSPAKPSQAQADQAAATKAILEAQIKQLQEAVQKLSQRPGSPVAMPPGVRPGARTVPPPAPAAPQGNYPDILYVPAAPPVYAVASKPGDMSQRLEQVERKLDTLLWEITSLRRDMAGAHGLPRVAPPAAKPSGGLPAPGRGPTPASSTPSAGPRTPAGDAPGAQAPGAVVPPGGAPIPAPNGLAGQRP